jgi:hypothetical protein
MNVQIKEHIFAKGVVQKVTYGKFSILPPTGEGVKGGKIEILR